MIINTFSTSSSQRTPPTQEQISRLRSRSDSKSHVTDNKIHTEETPTKCTIEVCCNKLLHFSLVFYLTDIIKSNTMNYSKLGLITQY